MLGETAALTAAFTWAVASLMFTRLGRDDVSPLAMNLLKCVIAVGLLIPTLMYLDGRIWPTTLTTWQTGILAVSGVAGLTLGDTAYFGALTRIGPRRSLLLWALSPPMAALLAVPILDEPITIQMAVGLLLTVGGVVWVILERPADDEDDQVTEVAGDGFSRTEMAGIAFGVFAAACQAGGNVLAKLGGPDISSLELSVVRLAFGVAGLGLVVGATSRMGDVIRPMKQPRKASLIFVATIIGTYLGIWLLMAGVQNTYAGVAVTLSSTGPVWILPLAYVFEDERITRRAVVGAIIAVVGIAVLFVEPEYVMQS
jgi:drug/metabolite transporter (DMT)-like permease